MKGKVYLSILILIAFPVNGLLAQCPTKAELTLELRESVLVSLRDLSDRVVNCSGDTDTIAAALHHKLSTHYYNEWDSDSAIFYTQRALGIREQLYGEAPVEDLGKSYYNLGLFQRDVGEVRKAISPLEHSIVIFEELEIEDRLHEARLELSKALGEVGEYSRAKQLLRLAIASGQVEGNNYGLAKAYHDLGLLWQQQGLYLRADTSLTIATTRYLNDSDPDYWSYANCILTLATVKHELGNFSAATENYLTALRQYSEFDDPVGVALAANSLGLAYVENNRTKFGFQYLQRGLNVAKKAGLIREQAQALDHFGEYYLAINRPEKAVASFQQAQEVLIPGYKAGLLTSVPSDEELDYVIETIDLLRYLNDQAKGLEALHRQEGNDDLLAAALTAYRKGDLLIDQLREDHDGLATKLIWREKATRLYEEAIRLCQQTNNAEDAYYFFEKSKAVLLYEAMVEGDALSSLPDSLRQQERKLFARVEVAREQLQQQDGGDQGVYADLLSARQALESFRNSLRSDFPAFQTMNKVPEVTRWQSLTAEVLEPNNQWMVQYFTGGENAYALVVRPAGLTLYDLGATESLQLEVDSLLTFFTSASNIANNPGQYTRLANSLYQKLLAPLNLPGGQSLLVIPDGVLTYLPLSALTTTAEFPGSFSALPTVLQRHQISYGYSATTLLRQQQLPDRKSSSFAAFAPFGNGSSPTQYPRLDFSRDELSTLSEVFSINMYANKEATRSQFLTDPQKHRILHLSTHAFSSPREKAPHIAFYDSLLYLQDVYRLPLTADLVVLSACQTNIGKNAPGEGTLGLGRGFAQAGARGIVSSLWNVNATSTGRVLEHFYQALNQQTTAGKALHDAKVNYCANASIPDVQKSPYYWAGLTYYGSEQMIELEPASSNLMYLTLLLPLVIVGVVALVRTYS